MKAPAKKYKLLLLGMIIGLLGCNSVREFSTSGMVQKRKYQKGYHLDKFHNRTSQPSKQTARFKDTMPGQDQASELSHVQLETALEQEPGKELYAGPGLPATVPSILSSLLAKKMPTDTFEYYRPNPVLQKVHKNAIASKRLGIVGLSTFFPLHLLSLIFPLALLVITPLYLTLGIVGISLAGSAKNEINRFPKKWKGIELAKVGLILNWVTTGLAGLLMILYVWFVISILSSFGFFLFPFI